jgi:Cdc6-like AAA superfamily ATPase
MTAHEPARCPRQGLPAHLNPFRVDRVARFRYRLPAGTNWAGLINRAAQPGFVGAIVGPHGTGKTTLLDDLGERLAQTGRQCIKAFINADSAPPSRAELNRLANRARDADAILLIDGAGHLSPLVRRRLRVGVGPAAGLLVTAHRSLRRFQTLVRTMPRADVLAEMVADLAPDLADAIEPDVATRLRAHRGNVRDVIRELYDDVAAGRIQAGAR